MKLRPLEHRDAAEITRLICDWDVVQWLTMPPYPYALADAEWFIGDEASDAAYGIEFNGALAGIISLRNELGYWLGKPFWGQGLMTEAAEALIADHFANSTSSVTSAYIPGNAASCNVLTKLGFRDCGIKTAYARPLGRQVALQAMKLTTRHWAMRNPFPLETDRLILRPLESSDWRDLQRIGGQSRVARMLFSVKSPWPEADVKAWLDKSRWRGRLGFRLAVTLQDGPFIGTVGIGGDPLTCNYFVDPDHWSRGYTTEAMRAFLTACFARFPIEAVDAAHFADNPTSGRVLEKLGFEKTGEAIGNSAARLEKAPEYLYRLTRTRWKATT
ncbi:MAG: GNAT family N-acetyltransferase [Paracoccaceae bacterium]